MKLAEYLSREKIRASHFAARINVAPSTISRILRGGRHPSWDVASRISHLTGGLVGRPEDFSVDPSPDTEDDAA